MVYEYAIDPRIFKTSGDFFAIWNQVGPENGRLISALPKNWCLIVYDSITKSLLPGDIQRKKSLEACLCSPIPKNICCRRGISNTNSVSRWTTEVKAEHSKSKFKGIVTDDKINCHCLISSLDAISGSSNNPHWHLTTGEHPVPGSGVALAQYISSLLRLSKYVKFIDPYLNLNETEFRNPISQIVLELIKITSKPRKYTLEFHCTDSDIKITSADRKKGFDTFIQNLPTDKDGLSFKYKIWKISELREEIKDRFILTNITGIAVAHDLRENPRGWTLTNMGPNLRIEDNIQTDNFDFEWP